MTVRGRHLHQFTGLYAYLLTVIWSVFGYNRGRKSGKRAMKPLDNQINVFGDALQSCSVDPLTGFFRTGCCDADSEDIGKHFVCARVDDDFLQYSLSQGNDLITARPEFSFAGLKSGDQWCVCANRWLEAFNVGCAPPVVLTSTNSKVLGLVDLETLKSYAVDVN